MGTMYGTTYEYGDMVISGFRDENGNIIELSFRLECTGYWGKTVKIYVRPGNDGWYIEGGVNNQMADYMSNSWETWYNDGPFDTIDEAIEAGILWRDDVEMRC